MQQTSKTVNRLGKVALVIMLAIFMLAVTINSGDKAKAYSGDGPPISGLAPSGTINTTTASVDAYFEWFEGDGTESLTLDGVLLTNCTGSWSYPNGIDPWWWSIRIHHVSCPVTGLADGSHTIVASAQYTSDADGNPTVGSVSTDTGTFTVSTAPADSTAPTITSIVPSGFLTATSADVAVYYSDAGGINTASVSVYWYGPDTSLSASCGVYATYASCPQTGLPQGSHNIGVSVADVAGNVATGTGTVFIDTYAPSAGYMYPRNNYNTTPALITATLRDSTGPGWAAGTNSGVNYSAPVVVTLDGIEVTGCTINTGTGALSCPIVGPLSEGIHTTVITLYDLAGNLGTSTRAFVIDTSNVKPSISLSGPSARWGSYADYLARVLSVDWMITNTGATNAYSVSMTNTSNTNGITNSGSATASFGTINAGLSVMKTLKYSVPVSSGSWHTVNTATVKDGMRTTYSYGG
ncbi:MAG: hypothetical protein WC911_07540 [Thermoleophilia bacterium]